MKLYRRLQLSLINLSLATVYHLNLMDSNIALFWNIKLKFLCQLVSSEEQSYQIFFFYSSYFSLIVRYKPLISKCTYFPFNTVPLSLILTSLSCINLWPSAAYNRSVASKNFFSNESWYIYKNSISCYVKQCMIIIKMTKLHHWFEFKPFTSS